MENFDHCALKSEKHLSNSLINRPGLTADWAHEKVLRNKPETLWETRKCIITLLHLEHSKAQFTLECCDHVKNLCDYLFATLELAMIQAASMAEVDCFLRLGSQH